MPVHLMAPVVLKLSINIHWNVFNCFLKKHIDHLLNQSANIDTILLACTHYPLLIDKIKQFVPKEMTIVSQGEIVAKSLQDYLSRHLEIETKCSKSGKITFYTTDSA